MLAQRTTQQALRRFASSRPSTIAYMAGKDFIAPLAVATTRQTRPVTTDRVTPADSYQILVEQRKHRPVAPHLTIYQPQIPWVMSGLNRVTGVTLSGGFYLFGLSYLAAPLFGWHVESASLASAFASLPAAVKVGAKFAVAMPFTYHSFNGLRHLMWDTGNQFKNKEVIVTGWTVVAISTMSAAFLAVY